MADARAAISRVHGFDGSGFRFEALPSDVFENITTGLLGHELVILSYVNRRLYLDLLNVPAIWTARMRSHGSGGRDASTAHEAKRRYMDTTSFFFPGTDKSPVDANDRGACVPVPTFFRREGRFHRSPRPNARLSNHPFSMDIWFSILPSDDSKYDGGVLVGSQSIPAQATDRWADNHQQFVYMDTERTLYCSVLGHDEVVAERLEAERWHHLVLTFDGGEQAVYFNGRLVTHTSGSVFHEWRYLHYTQLGTGCISRVSEAKPTPDFTGWYAFRGLIDEFRLWKRALDDEEAEILAKGLPLRIRPVYSLRDSADVEHFGPVERVHCSRPAEIHCVIRCAKS